MMNFEEEPAEGGRPAQRRAVTRGGSNITRERVGLLVLGVLLAAAAIVIYRLFFEFLRAKDHLQTLTEEIRALRRNFTDSNVGSTCWKENIHIPTMALWESYGRKCYYFSSTRSSWEESRCWCQSQGGDLVKVETKEEQVFLDQQIRSKMEYPDDRFWIGLTDAEVEDTWVWVDGSPLDPSVSFWSGDEPSDWKGEGAEGEDCTRMGDINGGNPITCWFDRSCHISHKFVCQKQAGGDTCV